MCLRLLPFLLFICITKNSLAQVSIIISQKFNKKAGANLTYQNKILTIHWPVGDHQYGQVELNMEDGKPLFSRILLGTA